MNKPLTNKPRTGIGERGTDNREDILSPLHSPISGKTSKSLVDVQPLVDIVVLALQTAFVTDNVDGYRPASLLLIAKPESGKTTTIEEFDCLPFIYYSDEISVKPLIDNVFPKIQTKEIRFIMTSDILNSLKKQKSTREPLLQTLKSLVDEGVKKVDTYHKHYDYETRIKAGMIAGITRSELYASQERYSFYSDFKRYGFLSRLVPFTYEYPIDKLDKIFHYIMSGKAEDSNVFIPKIRQFKKEKRYELNEQLFSRLQRISIELAQYSDSYGIRVQKNLQKLCYANALLNNRVYVAGEDVDKILYLSRWMNFDFNPL
jgi:hypothetical protein